VEILAGVSITGKKTM